MPEANNDFGVQRYFTTPQLKELLLDAQRKVDEAKALREAGDESVNVWDDGPTAEQAIAELHPDGRHYIVGQSVLTPDGDYVVAIRSAMKDEVDDPRVAIGVLNMTPAQIDTAHIALVEDGDEMPRMWVTFDIETDSDA